MYKPLFSWIHGTYLSSIVLCRHLLDGYGIWRFHHFTVLYTGVLIDLVYLQKHAKYFVNIISHHCTRLSNRHLEGSIWPNAHTLSNHWIWLFQPPPLLKGP